MILVLLGPPGSGKGTQSKLLADKLELPHVSLGDILREEVRQETEIGKQIKEFIDKGNLAPNFLTIELTKKRLAKPDCKSGCILDGFPRSALQAEAFDEMLKEMGWDSLVIYFDINEQEVVERLCGRRSCKSCGAVFNLKFKPPKLADKCDLCGGALYLRVDDSEAAIRTRFEVYREQTKPLIDRYQKAGKLVKIDANGTMDQVFEQLLSQVCDVKN
ncbi:MAG: adenylate kinase [Candidatus Saganbacteria bacterium]|nr:adenylate kinase [Candidatus Saganbacteria bacterium]